MIGRGRLKLGLTYPAYPPPNPATESFSSTLEDEGKDKKIKAKRLKLGLTYPA